MDTLQCFWEGGPLDPYRYACLASQASQGQRVVLYSNKPPANLPAGVDTSPITALMQASPLDHHLIRVNGKAPGSASWTAIDVLKLPSLTDRDTEPGDSLSWAESFQLWLPEYNVLLQQRASQWQQLPLHLNFAAMAGIDLQCLPPPGSYLATLMANIAEAEATLPRPHHEVEAVRVLITQMLATHSAWLQPTLEDRQPWLLRVKGKAREIKNRFLQASHRFATTD